MAGAMRRMGIYLGLVEDDDPRGYGRYDSRQSDHLDQDRRYGRYADDHYDGHYDTDYAGGYAEDDVEAGEVHPVGEPEALPGRSDRFARPVGLASSGASGGSAGARMAALGGSALGGSALGGSALGGSALGGSALGGSALGGSALGGGSGSALSGGSLGSGPVGATAAKLVAREVLAPTPEPEPAPKPQPYRITTLHPRTYNEARTIGERFREGSPVIMNLTELDHSDARRLVDFAAGLIFGLRGSIEPVTAKVFLLSPQNVAVTAEDKERIREGGFSTQS